MHHEVDGYRLTGSLCPGWTENPNRSNILVFLFISEGLGTTHALVAAYVGDFTITGIAGKRFEQLRCGLRERLLWGSWKLQSSGLCGVSSSQKSEPHDCS